MNSKKKKRNTFRKKGKRKKENAMILLRRSNEAQCEIDDDSHRIEYGKALIYNSSRKPGCLPSTRRVPRVFVPKIFCFEMPVQTQRDSRDFPRATHRANSAIVFTTFAPSLSALSSTFARLCASQVLFPPRSTVFCHGERNVSSSR